jgi:hypothetical protein
MPSSIRGSTRSRLKVKASQYHAMAPTPQLKLITKPQTTNISHLLATKLRMATQAALTTRSLSRCDSRHLRTRNKLSHAKAATRQQQTADELFERRKSAGCLRKSVRWSQSDAAFTCGKYRTKDIAQLHWSLQYTPLHYKTLNLCEFSGWRRHKAPTAPHAASATDASAALRDTDARELMSGGKVMKHAKCQLMQIAAT